MKKILYCLLLALLPLSAFAQTDPDVLEFAVITDTHKFGPSADVRFADENIKAFVKYCNETRSIKFALHGGDLINSYDTNKKQALFCLERARMDFQGLRVPFYITKGNHDCNGKQRTADGRRDGTQIVTDHEFFNLFSPISPVNPLADPTDIVYDKDNVEGNYYYRDFPQQKFRLIVLNDYDRDSLEYFGYHGLQVKWLTEQALNFMDKENPEDWCFLMLGHGLSVNMYEHALNRIIHAYSRGELLEDSDHGVSYRGDFHNQKRAKMVAFLAGHQHEDIYQRTEDYNMITLTRGFATGGEVDSEPISFSHFTLNVREKTLLEHRIGRGRDRMYSYAPHGQIWPVSSFEGAEGMGDLTHAGKDGRILTVTNLKDSGIGSLRWAVEQKGSRLVVFNVAGTIELKSPLVIANDSISIYGQSAPGEGICLKGAPVKILASEVCMRYLHIRPGRQAGAMVDAISDGDFGQHNLILDHLSISYSTGHGIAIRRAKDVTVQYCIVSHLLHENLSNTEDAPAGILAGGFMTTYYKNLIANCANGMMFPNEEGQNRWVHVLRNMFYNWKNHAMYGGGKQGEITIEENFMQLGPATQDSTILDVAEDGTGRYYVSWNFIKDHPEYNASNWKLVNDLPGMPYMPLTYDEAERAKMHPVQRPQQGDFSKSCQVIAAFHYKPVWSGKIAEAIRRDVMLSVGCSRVRDSYDRQLLESILEEKPFGSQQGLVGREFYWPVIKPATEKKPELTAENVNQWNEERVKQEKSIVILFESTSKGHLDMYPRLLGYRDAITADTAHVAVVNGGDFLFGDILATASHGKTIINMMKHINYDAISLGNLDFSYPVEEMREIVKPLGQVITSCNLVNAKNNRPVFDPYIIRQYGSRKVAYIGLTMPRTMLKYSSAFADNSGNRIYELTEDNLSMLVQKNVDAARKAGADYVIAIPHFDVVGDEGPVDVCRLISQTRGIDVVLCYSGEVRNSKIQNIDGKRVAFASPSSSLESITKVIIANDGLITTEDIPASKMLFKNSVGTHMLDSLNMQFNEFINEKIADCNVKLTGLGPDGRYILGQETNGANLVADAYYAALPDCDVALVNTGSIRANLNPGVITRGKILEMLPFEDVLCKAEITGVDLHALLDLIAKNHPNHRGEFLVPSGMIYKVQKGKGASEIEILNRTKGSYETLDPAATYTIVATSFTMKDTNYGDILKRLPAIESGTLHSEAVIDFIEKELHGVIGNQYAESHHLVTFE